MVIVAKHADTLHGIASSSHSIKHGAKEFRWVECSVSRSPADQMLMIMSAIATKFESIDPKERCLTSTSLVSSQAKTRHWGPWQPTQTCIDH